VPFANNGGTLAISAGTLVFHSNYTTNGGTLRLSNGASVQFSQGLALASGSVLGGTGTIQGDVTTGGLVAPGNSPGALTIAGNLTLQSTSQFLVELGGTAQGTSYDFLNVTGTAALGGTLGLSLVNGFNTTARSTDSFTILSSAGLTGTFANVAVSGTRLVTTDGLGSFLVSYGANNVTLSSFVAIPFVAIPEPSTWALLVTGLGAIAVTGYRRRRR
jgi:hypothetical protein